MKVSSSVLAFLALASCCVPSAEVGKEGLLIDLSPHFTTRFDRPNFKGIGKELPSLNPVIDGLRFQLKGEVTLWSDAWAGRGKTHPVSVRDLAVDAKFDELHLVHHGNWHEVDGRVVAIARLKYADGTQHDFPIKWGEHVRSWMYLPTDEELPLGGDPNAKYIWLDPAKNNTRFTAWHMLWKTHFMNPHPDRLVRSLEFHSGMQLGPYSVVSAVVAKSDPTRPKTKSLDLGIPPRDFKGRVKITLKSAETGLPITNATIQTSARTKGFHLIGKCLEPDQNGQAVFRYWKEETSLVVIHGMAPGYLHNSRELEGEIDSEVVLELATATTIGGVVVDEAGKPMPDVTVKIPRSVVVTDQKGRWLADQVPSSELRRSLTLVKHGVPARRLRHGTDFSTADLLAKKARLVFPAGSELTGIIRDEKGKPVRDARVSLGLIYDKSIPEIRSDKEGRFKFSNLPRGQTYLTIRKWEQAPKVMRVDISSKNQSLEIELQPGHATMIHVRDPSGKPLPDVTVTGYPRGPRTYRVRQKTKQDGSVFFGGLPKAAMLFSFEKKGLRTHHESISPSVTKPYQVVIGNKEMLEGRVIDAETGQPIKSFTVIAGHSHSGHNQFHPPAKQFQNGSFKLGLEKLIADEAAFQVEAPGYYVHLSKPFRPEAPPQDLVVALRKGKGLQGRVISPDGKPVSDAQVTARNGKRSVYLRDGELYYFSIEGVQPRITRTDSHGRFQLNPEDVLADLLVSHETGFAQIPVAAFDPDQPVRLEEWGSFQGKVEYAGKTVARQIVGLHLADYQFAPIHLQMPKNPLRADPNGEVVLENLPPGEYRFAQYIPTELSGHYNWGHTVPVAIEAGKTATATLELEVKFRDVAGRVVVRGLARVDPGKISVTLSSLYAVKPPAGKSIPGTDTSSKRGYIRPRFDVRPQADGSFTVKNVPAARYRLEAWLENDLNPDDPPRGKVYKEFDIRPGSGTADLGVFIVLPYVVPGSTPKL